MGGGVNTTSQQRTGIKLGAINPLPYRAEMDCSRISTTESQQKLAAPVAWPGGLVEPVAAAPSGVVIVTTGTQVASGTCQEIRRQCINWALYFCPSNKNRYVF